MQPIAVKGCLFPISKGVAIFIRSYKSWATLDYKTREVGDNSLEIPFAFILKYSVDCVSRNIEI